MHSGTYDVFISYRRETSDQLAKHLYDLLKADGYRVFYDIECLGRADFNVELLHIIEGCKDFIIILAPNALDRCQDEEDWVRQELCCALRSGKNIIPFITGGFTFPKDLPEDIKDVQWKAGIEANVSYFDATVDRLKKQFMISKPRKGKLPVIVACVVLFLILWLWASNKSGSAGPDPTPIPTAAAEGVSSPTPVPAVASETTSSSTNIPSEPAQTAVASGETPTPEPDLAEGTLEYSIKNGTTLIVSANGGRAAMDDYSYYGESNKAPWYNQREEITEVMIEDGITTIGNAAFSKFPNLERVEISDSVERIGEHAFINDEKLSSVKMPAGLQSIDKYAFLDCRSLNSITIPDTVVYIGDEAFYGCSMNEISIPSSVETLGTNPFNTCQNLSKITVDENNPNFRSEDGILYSRDRSTLIAYPSGKPGSSFDFPEEVKTIESGAFKGSKNLINIKISDNISTIGTAAFDGSNLETIWISSSVEAFGVNPFRNCWNLTEIKVDEENANFCAVEGVLYSRDRSTLILYPSGKLGNAFTFPEEVKIIKACAFEGSNNLTGITIPDNIESIDWGVFGRCNNLKTVHFPNTVKNINDNMFYNCSALEDVTIPASIQEIKAQAFYGCTSLTDVYYAGTEEEWGQIVVPDGNEPLANAAVHYQADGPQ